MQGEAARGRCRPPLTPIDLDRRPGVRVLPSLIASAVRAVNSASPVRGPKTTPFSFLALSELRDPDVASLVPSLIASAVRAVNSASPVRGRRPRPFLFLPFQSFGIQTSPPSFAPREKAGRASGVGEQGQLQPLLPAVEHGREGHRGPSVSLRHSVGRCYPALRGCRSV
jgi:hypothetical protein